MKDFDDLFVKEYKQSLSGAQVMSSLQKVIDKTKPVVFCVKNDEYHPRNRLPVNAFCSWRGDYSQPTCYTRGDEEFSVDELLTKLAGFFGSTQHGYKGGEYRMSEQDTLWCDGSGEYQCMAISEVIECTDCVAFVIEKYDY